MKLSALNGFARVNPTGTVNQVDLQGHTPGHLQGHTPGHSTDMNAIPVGMILRKAKRKLGKKDRKQKRQERRALRQARRRDKQLIGQEARFITDTYPNTPLLQQRLQLLLDTAEQTGDQGVVNKIQKIIERVSTLQGSTNGVINNFVGDKSGTVAEMNGFALQGKKEREARRRRRKAKKEARAKAQAEKKRLRAEAKQKRLQRRAKRRELTAQERRAKRRDERRTRKAERQAKRQEARASRKEARRQARQDRQTARQEARAERQRTRQEARTERRESRREGRWSFGEAFAGVVETFGDTIGDKLGIGGDDSETRAGGGFGGGGLIDNLVDEGFDVLEDATGVDLKSEEIDDTTEKSAIPLPLIIGGGLVGAYLLTQNKKGKKGKRKK